MIDASPCGGIKAPAPETARDRILSDDELKAVWRAAEGIGWPFGPVTQLLALTGQRRSEVAGMTWREIDFGAKLWTLPRSRSKNNREHVIPLSEQALVILASVPKVESKQGYVFTFTGSTPITDFAKAKKRLAAAVGVGNSLHRQQLRTGRYILRTACGPGRHKRARGGKPRHDLDVITRGVQTNCANVHGLKGQHMGLATTHERVQISQYEHLMRAALLVP